MIDKAEILAVAKQTSLTPHVVEKDYVLGWMLAGIYHREELANNWIFKGGTCLKKCFFETYRFSEDLDFTLTRRPASRYLPTNKNSRSTPTREARSPAKARSAIKVQSLLPMPCPA
jgi:hypothetical protein